MACVEGGDGEEQQIHDESNDHSQKTYEPGDMRRFQRASIILHSNPALAAMALSITTQEWSVLGHGSNENVAASNDLDITTERVTSLLLLRVVALVSWRNQCLPMEERNPEIPRFSDWSTTTICRESLIRKQPWPKPITAEIIDELRAYVKSVLSQYREVSYHSFEHAYHVTISCNKLVDMMLLEEPSLEKGVHFSRKTFGIKHDPLMPLALIFSALVHDVEHTGVSNRQLVLENDELAILYNDQSVAEQRSLAIAFLELRKPKFKNLNNVLFASSEEYRRFRKTVINLVLTTDIASPERTQIVKSKWKEAFGDSNANERKLSRRNLLLKPNNPPNSGPNICDSGVMSMSDVTFDMSNRTGIMRHSEGSISITHEEGESDSSSVATRESMDEDIPGIDPLDGVIRSGMTLSASNHVDTVAPPPPPGVCSPRLSLSSKDSTSPSSPHRRKSLERSDGLRSSSLGEVTTVKLNDVEGNKPRKPRRRNGSIPSASSSDSLELPDDVQSTSQISCKRNREPRQVRSRRNSAPGMSKLSAVPKRRLRLGLRRSMDLSGEAIEHYQSSRGMPAGEGSHEQSYSELDFEADDIDELKATVVMEQLIKAADVGPNMQSWEHMAKWSSRLFFELKKCHKSGRGEDPERGWFENQISFLNFYVLPLGQKLEETGVFGNQSFVKIVERNREMWVKDGLALTNQIIEEWNLISNEGKPQQEKGDNGP